jgi:hypothetical protein
MGAEERVRAAEAQVKKLTETVEQLRKALNEKARGEGHEVGRKVGTDVNNQQSTNPSGSCVIVNGPSDDVIGLFLDTNNGVCPCQNKNGMMS